MQGSGSDLKEIKRDNQKQGQRSQQKISFGSLFPSLFMKVSSDNKVKSRFVLYHCLDNDWKTI